MGEGGGVEGRGSGADIIPPDHGFIVVQGPADY
jgi:hypothetical protein